MEFCIAILILERRAVLGQFTDATVKRPDVQGMIRRINFCVDPEAEAAGFDKMTSLIKSCLKDGRILSGRADFAKGSPADPMSFDETARKFTGCAEDAGWQRLDIDAIIEYVKKLDGQSDISKLSSLLTGKKA